MRRCAAIISVLSVSLGCGMLDQQYLYFPMPWEARDWKAESGLPLEDVWLRAKDGKRIFAWYVEAQQPRGVLLWCHGNAGNITHRLENLQELHRRGFSALILDYRGYGQSEGKPSEQGLYQDALAAYAYLREHKQIPPDQIVLFGRSLGSSVIVEVARTQEAAGLILETPFPSVESVARKLFAGMPAHLILEARFELVTRLQEIHIPVLVIHGDQDTIIPFELGQAVYAAANEPKQFYRIPGSDHNNTYVVGGETYFETLGGFVDSVVKGE